MSPPLLFEPIAQSDSQNAVWLEYTGARSINAHARNRQNVMRETGMVYIDLL
jgi:hypothetical protein